MNNELLGTLLQELDGNSARLGTLELYYTGRQPLSYLSSDARLDIGSGFTRMASNLGRLAVSALSERLRPIGFRMDGMPATELWNWWLDHDMDQLAPLVHREALALGSGFVSVWADADGRPVVAAESAHQVAILTDPATREVIGAVKRWETRKGTDVVLFEADKVTKLHSDAIGAGPTTGFRTVEVLDNPLGVCPVVPFVNADRLLSKGESELTDLVPLLDALNKVLADTMAVSEANARQRRFAAGVEAVEDENGNAINPFPPGDQMLLSESPDTKFGTLPGSDLTPYEGQVRVLLSQIMAVSGLPAHMVGVLTSSPSSADALRAAEASLTARAQARAATFGKSWERVAQLVLAVQTGRDPLSFRPSIQWADASTRSVAQEADATSKLVAAGILPRSYALRKLGYPADEIAAIEAEFRTITPTV